MSSAAKSGEFNLGVQNYDTDPMARGSLCEQDRKDYIKAVQCLMKQPPRSRYTYAPGSRSRYDDFAAIHLLLTLKIHFSVRTVFHRLYIVAVTLHYSHALLHNKSPSRLTVWRLCNGNPVLSPHNSLLKCH